MESDAEPWWRVRPPAALNGDLAQVLASVDALQRAWADVVRDESSAEFRESRQRNLRRHAIETGIIERLYDVDWGVTEALVAEGLSAEVAAREGGIDEGALETIRSQFEALTFLADAAGNGRDLSAHFIRELHTALCRSQSTFKAVDQFGRVTERPLRHGSWKQSPNQAHMRSGGVLLFAPPDQVDAEIDRLVAFYPQASELHPVVAAAWLHHAFVAIHPFDDGNGRVARALALLVLLRSRYAPLVVDRYSREDYLLALENANDGDLRALTRLFARLEVVALRAEIERPLAVAAAPAVGAGAVDVARAYVERLRAMRDEDATQRASRALGLADEIHRHVETALESVGRDLATQFRAVDPDATAVVFTARPPEPAARWWRAQIVRAARHGGFFANISEGTWWTHLRLTALGQNLRFVTVVQKVGHGETGVLALTVFAESLQAASGRQAPGDAPADGAPEAPVAVPLLTPDSTDSVTLVSEETLAPRLAEIDAVIEQTLAAAVARFAEGLG
ncbi:Fic family protein [Kineosporia sp. R_H_3]|uniref:Fic family protein n=1 Tax=Kineosporia sp. R_H_3 TaxID=1961848 RepID=UPI000B4A74E4|nr:Fic family protein [Kineosporia sp. R_H_3]